VVAGLRAHPFFPGAGFLILLFFVPLASGTSMAVWQLKVPPEMQGRVFSVRSLISQSMMPLAFLISGPLADYVFEPLMRDGGRLANTFIGALLGTGPGRGIGLMFVISGILAILVSGLAYLNPHIRDVEQELPDAVAD
jgi:DHA3 family macrolide efflux protein-like MFS transporter